MKPIRRVLVIKLSALGDFVLATAAFERIRAAHPDARITLLTTPPFEPLASSSPFFDQVDTDGRPKGVDGWLRLVSRLRGAGYDRVYDLQNSGRTRAYFQALRPFAPAWSGTARGCALPHRNPRRMEMHALERQAEQLAQAGIWPDAPTRPMTAPPPDLSWLLAGAAPSDGAPPSPLVLLVPGSAAHRPEKRWPVACYAELSERLQERGLETVIIGGPQETALAEEIRRRNSRARDLTGRTDFARIAALGARAALAVGNDTGPIHLISAVGAPTIALFSSASHPHLSGPRGDVTTIQAARLDDIPVTRVLSVAVALAGSSRRTA